MSDGLLPIKRVEKVWGRNPLPTPFAIDGEEVRIGEIWFDPPLALSDVLVKYLFTNEKLSVQVHPGEEASPTGRGKEECWLILEAEPGACLAMGFRQPIDPAAMRTAALDGSIEDLLEWHEVEAGDFFFIPAGTVHAIGPGLTLLEVQQNTDITYRLYDYGRPRELHLDEAIEVARGEPYSAALKRKIAADEETMLVDGPRFRLAQTCGAPSAPLTARFSGPVQLMPLAGEVRIAGQAVAAGESAVAASLKTVDFDADARVLIAASA